ncbi:MAG TPA: RNA methyltransferase [Pseudobdellovibrionaceae bacterium]|nr:RNA methyltransferase [Pseudobdellovibrionaceae bacterium]
MSFIFEENIHVEDHLKVNYQMVLDKVGPLLTEERQKKIAHIVEERNFSILPVLEGIYDRGNISAVMRSAEAMGFVHFHVIESQEKFKEANRVTQGADKWVEVQKWKDSKSCIQNLKSKGYRLCVTTLEGAVDISEVDFTIPTALVLGNEKEGVSSEMLAAADVRVKIPMVGFVQSYNISVAGALSLYHIFQDRKRKLGRSGDLSEVEKKILTAHYYLRSQPSGVDYLRRLFGDTQRA